MILDKAACLAENISVHNKTDWFDMVGEGIVESGIEMGPGEPIQVLLTGKDLVFPVDKSYVNVYGRYDSDFPMERLNMSVYFTGAEIFYGGLVFGLATNVDPSIQMELVNVLDGLWSAYIVMRVT